MENLITNKHSVLIAIDIAKRSHDVVIKTPDHKTKHFKISNTLDGYQEILQHISGNESVTVAFEPTADYHRNIAHWLDQQGLECHLASSLACARAREMIFNSWDKNDRKDANVILYLLENGLTKPFHDPLKHNYLDIQELSNTYHQISIARGRCYHSLLNHYLTLYFPEMEIYHHASRAEWFCKFLLKFPTPQSITRYKLKTFVKRAWDIVGRKQNKPSFLEHLYHTAENSIGLPVPIDSMAVQMYRLQVERYLELTCQRMKLEKTAQTLLAENKDFQVLLSVPGIGPVIALMIIAESGDLRRFSHHRKYLSFCGFNLSASQSGQKSSNHKLSKRGNSRLRYAFWLAATMAIRMKENSFAYKYQSIIAKNPLDKDLQRKARTAIAIKMARVVHALIKKNLPYQGYYEVSYGT